MPILWRLDGSQSVSEAAKGLASDIAPGMDNAVETQIERQLDRGVEMFRDLKDNSTPKEPSWVNVSLSVSLGSKYVYLDQ
ncbi:hypothetical protein H632_c839p0, partial [Helicosporidium sp. ATCC 50920]